MFQKRRNGFLIYLVLVGLISAGLAFPVMAMDAKEVNDLMRKAERMSFSGKAKEADEFLKKAEAGAQAIMQGDNEEEKTRVKRLESKMKYIRKQLDRKLKTSAKKPSVEPQPAATEASASTVSNELPSYVASKLNVIRGYLDNARAHLDEGRTDNARGQLRYAQENIDLTEERYSKYNVKDHPDMLALKKRKADLEAAIPEMEKQKAEAEDQAEAAAKKTQDAISADVEQFMEMYDKYKDKFSIMHEHSQVHGMNVEDAEKALAYFDIDENEIYAALKTFTEKYGADRTAIDENFRKLNYDDPQNAANRVGSVIEKMENLKKSRKATAAAMVQNIKTMMSSSVGGNIKIRRAKESREILKIGHQIYPNDPELNRMLAGIDDEIEALEQTNEEEIDKARWKDHVSDFAGPGSVKSLSKAAMDYFSNSPNWGKNTDRKIEILRVSVQGQWQVAERNVLGYILSWRLPIHLAYTTPEYREKNQAKVIELSAVAAKASPGEARKAPPFVDYWVGDSWLMRLDRLK